MPRITPMLPTVFIPSGTAHRVVLDVLARAEERELPANASGSAKDAPQPDRRQPLPSAA